MTHACMGFMNNLAYSGGYTETSRSAVLCSSSMRNAVELDICCLVTRSSSSRSMLREWSEMAFSIAWACFLYRGNRNNKLPLNYTRGKYPIYTCVLSILEILDLESSKNKLFDPLKNAYISCHLTVLASSDGPYTWRWRSPRARWVQRPHTRPRAPPQRHLLPILSCL